MINWCIIGSGDVVQRLLNKSIEIKNKSKLITIISKDFKNAKKYAAKFNNVNALELSKKNLEIINNNSKINSIYIATPPSSHFYYINFFCRKKRNIICEKPLVIKLDEIKKLQKLQKSYRFNLFTCFYRRYLKKFNYIKKIVNSGRLGKILFFKTKYLHNEKNHPTANLSKNNDTPWRFKKKISGGGNIADMGIHIIDMIDYLLGDICEVNAFNSNLMKFYNVEDTSVVNFKLKNNILGQGFWNSTSPFKEDDFKIVGRKGELSFKMNFYEKDQIKLNLKNKKQIIKEITTKQPYHSDMFDFIIKKLTRLNRKGKIYFDKTGLKNSEILLKILNY